MKRYTVWFKEERFYKAEVEAESEEDALKVAESDYYDNELESDSCDDTDVKFLEAQETSKVNV